MGRREHPLGRKTQWTPAESERVLRELTDRGLAERNPSGEWHGTAAGADWAIRAYHEMEQVAGLDELLALAITEPLAFLARAYTFGYGEPSDLPAVAVSAPPRN